MVMHAGSINLSQRWRGKSGSVSSRMEMKWCLTVRICLSSTFILWFPVGTIFQLMLFLSISFYINYDASIFKHFSLGLDTLLVR